MIPAPNTTNVDIKAQSVQMMAQVKGLVGQDLHLTVGKFNLKVDKDVFPFIAVGDTVLVILSVVRVGAVDAPPPVSVPILGGPH